METKVGNKPGTPIYDHLFCFSTEEEARQALPAFQVEGHWSQNYVVLNVKIVLARPQYETSSGEPILIRSQRELSGYRLIVCQSEPRLDLWDTIPQLEGIGDRDKAEKSRDFYVRVRSGCEEFFYLMEPIPAGAIYAKYRTEFLGLSVLDGKPRHLDAARFHNEIDDLAGAIEELMRQLRAQSSASNEVYTREIDDLGIMLVLLREGRFVNANALERLLCTTVATLAIQLRSDIGKAAMGAAALQVLDLGYKLLAAGWGH